MESNYRTIITAGKPGVGKSYLGNFILSNNPKSQIFQSESNPKQFGVTKQIQYRKQYAQHLNCTLEYIDVPGAGDPTISIKNVVDDLVQQLSAKTINAALMLVAAQDERASANEVLTISFLKNFFNSKGISTQECLWLVITRCQEKMPEENFVQGKLEFLSSMGLVIRQDHVILFDNTTQSLSPFIQEVFKIQQNQGLQVEQNTEQALQNFSKDLQSVAMKDPCIKKEFEQFEMLMRLVMDQNDKLATKLEKQADALQQITSNQYQEMMKQNDRLATHLGKQAEAMQELARNQRPQSRKTCNLI
ncbi:hypothetical protein ABPG74_007639 [Tetrahymena malaccensis]